MKSRDSYYAENRPRIKLDLGIDEAERKANKPIEQFGYSDFVKYFFAYYKMSLFMYTESRASLKAYLLHIQKENDIDTRNALKALDSVSYSDLEHQDTLQNEFFKDFRTFFTYINQTIENDARLKDNDLRKYDTIVASLILAWCGIRIEDATEVLKESVDRASQIVMTQNGSKHVVPEDGIEFLHSYSCSDGYYKKNSKGKAFMKYKPSQYLLRNYKSEKLTPYTLLVRISTTFSEIEHDKRLYYDSVRWSGIFSRAYRYEWNNENITLLPKSASVEERKQYLAKLGTLFDEEYKSTNMAYVRLRQYQAYKEYFFTPKD